MRKNISTISESNPVLEMDRLGQEIASLLDDICRAISKANSDTLTGDIETDVNHIEKLANKNIAKAKSLAKKYNKLAEEM